MIATLLALAAFAPSQPVQADTILVHGKIWTGQPARPEVAALAVWNGQILKAGTNEEIQALAGPNTKTIDLKNRVVVPGFYDSHLHFLGGGRSLAQVDLKDAKDEAEFGKRLKEWDANTPRSRWLLGGNWDHDRTFGGGMPTAAMVDKYVKDRPVFIHRYDGHMALANSKALEIAGISAGTKEIPGGVIYRLADDITPSGVLKDNAMNLMDKHIAEPDDEEILEAIRAAMKACSESGLTSVQDMDGSSPVVRQKLLRMLQTLDRKGELSVRVDLRWPIALYDEVAKLGIEANFGGGFVRLGGVKGFMDGSLGSSTAKMFEPFENEKNTSGVFVTEPAAMKNLVRQADKAGLSIAIHAIGDQANASLLDIFQEVGTINGPRDRRFRIEHVQHLRPGDYPRFKTLGVVASMQPYHVIDDGRWAEGRIGAARCESSYAYRSLLDNGATLAFGSDWPVAPLNVLAGIDAAVIRRTLDGKHPNGWYPKQRITVAEAVRAYTNGSAYAGSQEKERGTLEAGKVADLAVLSMDIFDPKQTDKLAEAKVELTMVNGKVVYQRPAK